MGTHPIFESDFDCLTEKDLIKKYGHHSRYGCRPLSRTQGDQEHRRPATLALNLPRRTSSSRKPSVRSWASPHMSVALLSCSVCPRTSVASASSRSVSVPTSAPSPSVRKCLVSSSNSVRPPPLASTKLDSIL